MSVRVFYVHFYCQPFSLLNVNWKKKLLLKVIYLNQLQGQQATKCQRLYYKEISKQLQIYRLCFNLVNKSIIFFKNPSHYNFLLKCGWILAKNITLYIFFNLNSNTLPLWLQKEGNVKHMILGGLSLLKVCHLLQNCGSRVTNNIFQFTDSSQFIW